MHGRDAGVIRVHFRPAATRGGPRAACSAAVAAAACPVAVEAALRTG
eukprot:gene200-32947_t